MISRTCLCACLLALPVLAQALGSPLDPPPELVPFARKATGNQIGTKAKLQALLAAMFRPQEEGGLGIIYDNGRTRSLTEVWQERKANCLSMTAFFVAACRGIGIEAKYAEPTNTNRWRKVGSVIRFERHVVGLIPLPPLEDVVADFLPQLRRRYGAYMVNIVSEPRLLSLFHSNRAVEFLEAGNMEEATQESIRAMEIDPTSSVGWNIRGVILRAGGDTTEGEKAFRKAMQVDPRDGAALGNLESLCRDQGRFEEAARFRIMAQELRKKDPYFHAFLAEEALLEENLTEARTRIGMALRLHPQESEFHLLLARIQLLEGQAEAAVKSIEQAKKWALPAEKERYANKLDALKKREQEGQGEDPGRREPDGTD